jgi:F-type H+-transporting ATPase subunit b
MMQASLILDGRSRELVEELREKMEAAAVRSKAEKDIEREKQAAVNEIRDDIASIAISVAEKVIEKDIDEKDHEKLVEDFINSWGDNK